MGIGNIGTRIQELILGIISAVVLLVVGIALGPTVVSAIADINATSMASVEMGSVIVMIADYVPFLYYLGLVVGAMIAFWAAVRFGPSTT